MNTPKCITASEIGEYVYCQRAWWLRIQGLGTTNIAMLNGQIKHTRLSQWLAVYKKLLVFAVVLLLLGILLAIISLFFFV